nr:hypothetical protein [Tanacetum cinerariifolium]
MLIVVPFHNLELGDSDDPPLVVYIESRFPVNCEPIELLMFPPPVKNSPKGVPVVVYRLLTSQKFWGQCSNAEPVHDEIGEVYWSVKNFIE